MRQLVGAPGFPTTNPRCPSPCESDCPQNQIDVQAQKPKSSANAKVARGDLGVPKNISEVDGTMMPCGFISAIGSL